MPKITVLTMGDSGTWILPDGVLEHLKAKVGDELLATETPRGYQLTRFDPEAESSTDGGEQPSR